MQWNFAGYSTDLYACRMCIMTIAPRSTITDVHISETAFTAYGSADFYYQPGSFTITASGITAVRHVRRRQLTPGTG